MSTYTPLCIIRSRYEIIAALPGITRDKRATTARANDHLHCPSVEQCLDTDNFALPTSIWWMCDTDHVTILQTRIVLLAIVRTICELLNLYTNSPHRFIISPPPGEWGNFFFLMYEQSLWARGRAYKKGQPHTRETDCSVANYFM